MTDHADFTFVVTRGGQRPLYRSRQPEVEERRPTNVFAPRRRGPIAKCARSGGTARRFTPRAACSTTGSSRRTRRHRPADHRSEDRSLSLCGHPLVLHCVRSRRHDLGLADAVGQSRAGARGAGFLAQHQSTVDGAFQRRGARQDHARNAQGRDGGAGASFRSAAITAGSTRRHCSSISPAPTPTAPATWPSSTKSGRRSCAAAGWMERCGQSDPDGFVTYQRAAETGLATRAGRTAPMPSSMPTAASHTGRSRWSRCRATSIAAYRGLAVAGRTA